MRAPSGAGVVWMLEFVLGVLPSTLCYFVAAPGLLLFAGNMVIVAIVNGDLRAALVWMPFAAFFLVGGLMGIVGLWFVALHRSRLRAKPLLSRRMTLLSLAAGIAAALPVALSLEGTNLPTAFRVPAALSVVVALRYAFVTERESIDS